MDYLHQRLVLRDVVLIQTTKAIAFEDRLVRTITIDMEDGDAHSTLTITLHSGAKVDDLIVIEKN